MFRLAESGHCSRAFLYLRPSRLYVYERRASSIPLNSREVKLKRTSVGIGRSSGAKVGKVEENVIKNRSHMIPCEDVVNCAAVIAERLGRQLQAFKEEEEIIADFNYREVGSQRVGCLG